MNEIKIKELLEQAQLQTVEEANRRYELGDTSLESAQLLVAEKFAELIVRECAEFVEHEIEVAGYKAKRILKHFGVEE